MIYELYIPLVLEAAPLGFVGLYFPHSIYLPCLITESVDSVCRNGTVMPYVAIQMDGSLGNSATDAAICYQTSLAFIAQCSVTNKTLKVAIYYM